MKSKVLFILKYRESSGGHYGECWSEAETNAVANRKELSSGLLNSARFVASMLGEEGVPVKLVQVADNNDIDREVTLYKPTRVILEALWVVPEKFSVLCKLHPHVKWIIRGHSEVPFLANEGVALEWITKYILHPNVYFASNSVKSVRDIRAIVSAAHPEWSTAWVNEKIPYLPNYYPHRRRVRRKLQWPTHNHLNVACFGAIRPLKNQLTQAVAAIEFADLEGKKLRFHINATRVEQGNNVLKNLEALFEATPHELVKHEWMPHEEFLGLLETMDVAMQVSLSETFNIVAADCVVSGLPIVVSSELPWTTPVCQAKPTSTRDIVVKLRTVTGRFKKAVQILNLRGLRNFCEKSRRTWISYLK